jgi:hypothetical protein
MPKGIRPKQGGTAAKSAENAMQNTRKNKLKHTIALSEEAWNLAELIGCWYGISLPAVFEMAIRKLGKSEGFLRVPKEYMMMLALPSPREQSPETDEDESAVEAD